MTCINMVRYSLRECPSNEIRWSALRIGAAWPGSMIGRNQVQVEAEAQRCIQ